MNHKLFNRINWDFHIESKCVFDKYVELILKNKNSLSEFASYCPISFAFLKQVDAYIDILKISLTNNYNILSTNVYVDYIIEDKFAYPIYIHHKNKDFIAIKTAFIFKLWDILSILFGDNNYLNTIGKNTDEDGTDKELIRELILKSFDHSVLGTVYEINYSKTLTECNIRDSIKNIVYNMMIQFSFYHEFGHYIFKHKITYTPKNSEIESDFFALHNIIEMLFGFNHPYRSLYDKYSNEDKLYFLSLSIILLLHILETIYIIDSSLFHNQKIKVNYNSNHPINSIRCNFKYIKNIASKSLENFCSNNYEELLILFETKFQQAYDEVRFIWEDLELLQVSFHYEKRINKEIEELFKNFKWEKIECTMFRP
jgi:hypothetical protein